MNNRITRHFKPKRKLISMLFLTTTIILSGHLFFWGCLLGYLLSKRVASKLPGKRGKFKSIIIPFLTWRLHLHHWLYSTCLICVLLVLHFQFAATVVIYGILGGFIFQGVYHYDDWSVVISKKRRSNDNT